jgi:hypothetical protein
MATAVGVILDFGTRLIGVRLVGIRRHLLSGRATLCRRYSGRPIGLIVSRSTPNLLQTANNERAQAQLDLQERLFAQRGHFCSPNHLNASDAECPLPGVESTFD